MRCQSKQGGLSLLYCFRVEWAIWFNWIDILLIHSDMYTIVLMWRGERKHRKSLSVFNNYQLSRLLEPVFTIDFRSRKTCLLKRNDIFKYEHHSIWPFVERRRNDYNWWASMSMCFRIIFNKVVVFGFVCDIDFYTIREENMVG